MLLHAGRDFVLNTRDIIGFFDLDNTTRGPLTNRFLAHAQQEGAVVDLAADLPRSFIVADFPAETVYLTELSTAALKSRAERFSAK